MQNYGNCKILGLKRLHLYLLKSPRTEHQEFRLYNVEYWPAILFSLHIIFILNNKWRRQKNIIVAEVHDWDKEGAN